MERQLANAKAVFSSKQMMCSFMFTGVEVYTRHGEQDFDFN